MSKKKILEARLSIVGWVIIGMGIGIYLWGYDSHRLAVSEIALVNAMAGFHAFWLLSEDRVIKKEDGNLAYVLALFLLLGYPILLLLSLTPRSTK